MKNPLNRSLNSQIHSLLRKIEADGIMSAPRGLQVKELEIQIRKMNNKTSIDEFEISNIMLKNMPYEAKNFLLKIMNECLKEGKIPSKWKSSIIKMIPKKSNDKHNIDNYRPISITPCAMRLFERVLLERLKKHLDENNIIVKQQSGFREKRSTRDNLFFLAQKSFESFNKNKSTVAIFFDIAAAFDKVWHGGLIDKLIKIKTPLYLLKIIIAFLSDRKFRVKVGNFTTGLNDIKCGVPQGACLSPTLFSIYINDCPNRNIANKENTLIFADDLGYFFFFKRMTKSILDKINKYLDELNLWSKKWRLKLATSKCNYMILTRKNKIKTDCEIELKLDGVPLEKVNSTKFLGLRIDNRCNFNEQVEYIKTTCQERMNILKIVSHKSCHLDTHTRTQIHKSLVRSLLEYSAFIYGTLSTSLKTP
jgi:hypothetical protein